MTTLESHFSSTTQLDGALRWDDEPSGRYFDVTAVQLQIEPPSPVHVASMASRGDNTRPALKVARGLFDTRADGSIVTHLNELAAIRKWCVDG
jgi:hypothetical protein